MRFICNTSDLAVFGSYKIFPATSGKDGIVVNVAGAYHAYINYCPHAGGNLLPEDCNEGDKNGQVCLLKCQLHGSHFDASSGNVITPPAETPLRKLELIIEDGKIYLK